MNEKLKCTECGCSNLLILSKVRRHRVTVDKGDVQCESCGSIFYLVPAKLELVEKKKEIVRL